MPRFILVPLLAFGVIAGFGSGFRHLHEHREEWMEEQQERLAQVCANAAAAQIKALTPVSATPTVVNAGTSAAAQPPVSAPVQQISQAPAPVVIITGNGSQPVQVIPAPAAPAAPAK